MTGKLKLTTLSVAMSLKRLLHTEEKEALKGMFPIPEGGWVGYAVLS
jgi:hypothetical protein